MSKIVKINELDTNYIYIIELSKDLPKRQLNQIANHLVTSFKDVGLKVLVTAEGLFSNITPINKESEVHIQ